MACLLRENEKRQNDALTTIRSSAVSVGGVLAVTLLRLLLGPVLNKHVPFMLYLPAVLIGAWLGGWTGGLSAVLFSTLAASYFFVSPTHSFLIRSHDSEVSLIAFVVVGLCISALGDAQRKARRQAEQAAADAQLSAAALIGSEERLRLALDGGEMGTWHWDLKRETIDWSPKTKILFGLPPDAAVERSYLLGMIHSQDRVRVIAAMQTAIAGGPDYDEEYRVVWPDGSLHWLAARGRVHCDNQGAAVSIEGIIQNIDDRKRAEEERAAAYQREVLLNQIGQAARNSHEPEELQSIAVRALGEALNVDRAHYNTYDLPRDRSWIGEDYRRAELPTMAGEYRVSDFKIDITSYYPDGRPLVIHDLNTVVLPSPMIEAVKALRVCAAISVPLFDGGALVGALTVIMADEPREWTDAEVELVKAVAQQTRAALEASAAEQREHRIATELQEALLPTIPERVPGLRLAHHYRAALLEAGIGGDFAAVFSEDKGISYLVVGDLAGKGLAAASQISIVTNMLRFAVHNGRNLADAVKTLNDTLADSGLLSGFATLFIGRYDAAMRVLSYVNCGQDAGLVRRADSGKIIAMPPTGPVLGAFSRAAYMEESVILEPGDVLALYTDGLTEAGPTRTALLTGDGVANLLAGQPSRESAGEVVVHLIAGVDAHAQGVLSDDQCLLVGIVDG